MLSVIYYQLVKMLPIALQLKHFTLITPSKRIILIRYDFDELFKLNRFRRSEILSSIQDKQWEN